MMVCHLKGCASIRIKSIPSIWQFQPRNPGSLRCIQMPTRSQIFSIFSLFFLYYDIKQPQAITLTYQGFFNQFFFIGLDDALDALAKEQKQQEIVATKYQSKSINVTENGEGVTSVTVSLPSSKRTSRCGSVNRDQQVSISIYFDKFMGSKNQFQISHSFPNFVLDK